MGGQIMLKDANALRVTDSRLFIAGLLAVVFTFGILVPAKAQTFRGGISGTVVDTAGATLPGATIKIINKATAAERIVQTGSDGNFSVTDLPLGLYTVEVGLQNFQATRVSDVEVSASQVTNLELTLRVGTVNETVDVKAESVVKIDTSSATLTWLIGPKQVRELPLNGRDYRQLVQLVPGAGGAAASTGAAPSINGSRPRGNNFQIDGVNNNDTFQNLAAANQNGLGAIAGTLLPVEAIDQFSVQSNAGAELGRNSGGAINLVIKSGGNDVHGSAFYFNRNEALAANSPVALPDSPVRKVRNHQYGGSVGGPVIRNRTFFFLAFEAQRGNIGNALLTTTPSIAWVNSVRPILSRYNVPVNPVSLNIVGVYPGRDAPAVANNFLNSDDSTYKSDNGIIKIDHTFSQNYNISARYWGGTGEQVAFAAASPFTPYFQTNLPRAHNYSIVQNSIFKPNLLNSLVFGVNYYKLLLDITDKSVDVEQLGLVTGSPVSGLPGIAVSGFGRLGGGALPPAGRDDLSFQLTDTATYLKGNHELKFGFDLRRGRVNVYYKSNLRGTLVFDGSRGPWRTDATVTTTQRALADLLAGFVRPTNGATIIRGNPERYYHHNSLDGFAQDTWKVSQRLTLTLGLRYNYNTPVYDDADSLTNFIPDRGFVTVGRDIATLYPKDLNDFSPRLGFAYALGKDDKTVLRGNYGLFYDLPANTFFSVSNAGNGAATGLGNNPAGPNPVFTVGVGGAAGNTTPDIVSGVPVFGGAVPRPPFGAFAVSQGFRTPYVHNFGLNVQREMTSRTVLQVGYAGSLGHKLSLTRNINSALPGIGSVQSRRPFNSIFPQLSAINMLETTANSHYHALQVSLNQGMWKGLATQLFYTWSHTIDTASDARARVPTNSYNIRNDRGNADFDLRHNFRASLTYDIPVFSESLPKRLTQGWQANAIMGFTSGQPINITAGLDRSGNGDGFDRVDLIGDPFAGVVQAQNQIGRRYFNPAAFALPAIGTFGTLGRNALYGPGFKVVDVSLFKTTKLTERVALQFRAEVFNVFNFVNWANPGTIFVSSTNFGLMTDTRFGGDAPGIGQGEPRNVQLALKLVF